MELVLIGLILGLLSIVGSFVGTMVAWRIILRRSSSDVEKEMYNQQVEEYNRQVEHEQP